MEIRKSVSQRIIEGLIAVPNQRFSALARAIGVDPVAMSTPVGTLRRIGVLAPADPNGPADPNQRAPLMLSADARAKIAQGETIRDRRGFVLWPAERAGEADLRRQ